MYSLIKCTFCCLLYSLHIQAQYPKGFTVLSDQIPSLDIDLGYATSANFMGRPVRGYKNAVVLGTKELATQLENIQNKLLSKGLGLKIFDAYRPQTAVNDFIQWAKIQEDTLKKRDYYPKIAKIKLFDLGYIASKSGHSRGSTVDLTIIYTQGAQKGKTLDMGGSWDFFGSRSNYDYSLLTPAQQANRKFLRELMITHGFKPYDKEWWHFTIQNEPFPDTYFDFLFSEL